MSEDTAAEAGGRPVWDGDEYARGVRDERRVGWPATAALTAGGITVVSEALLGWWSNWVDTGTWRAEAFLYPISIMPVGVILTVAFALLAGAGFGPKNRLLGVVAGVLPLVGIVAMVAVSAIPGAAPGS